MHLLPLMILMIILGSCSKLAKIIKVSHDNYSVFEFDSRVGLNCS